jgi:NADH oxidase (H2O2-forming)
VIALPKQIVVVGGGAAGTAAALEARRTDRTAQITLINREKLPEYSRCGLPYVISKVIPKPEKVIIQEELALRQMMRIDLRLQTEVTDVDMKNRIVMAETLNSGEKLSFPFDSLVLALGAKPGSAPVQGLDGKKNVFKLRTLHDAEEISKLALPGKTVAILGASLIGMELAEGFSHLRLKVIVIHRSPETLSTLLDPDMSQMIRVEAEKEGVKFVLGTTIQEIGGSDTVEWVKTAGGDTFKVDLMAVATGTPPETALARKIGAKTGKNGGILVDDHMCVGVENVYAAGDCVEYPDVMSGQPNLIQLGTIAVRMGRVAGANAAGENVKLPPLLGTTTSRLFGLELGTVGFTTRDMNRRGMKPPVYGKTSTLTKPEYFPTGKPISAKLLVDSDTHKIVGAQIVGGEDAAQRVNVVALAMKQGLTVEELARLETCYAPPVAPVWDPIILAAESAARKLKASR